jgi:hypothetical protein
MDHSTEFQQHVLERLAQTRPRRLCEKDTLREMYESCREVQLFREGNMALPAEDMSHLEQLHRVFDVALDNNLVFFMTHFVDEVRKRVYELVSCHVRARGIEERQLGFAIYSPQDRPSSMSAQPYL